MEQSKFKSLCRAYVASLCTLALAIPLATDTSLRHSLSKSVKEALLQRQSSEHLFAELEQNRVRLSEDLADFGPATSSVSSIVVKAAAKHRMDPALVRAVIHVESGTNPVGLSPKGALGFMQLMPATARRLGIKDLSDPVQNIYGGTKYLRHLMDMFDNDVRLALAAYNAGPARVRQYNGVPPYRETQQYVRQVMTAYRGFRQIYS